MKHKKKEILDQIFLKEEDVLLELDSLVKMAMKFIKIEKESGEVIFSQHKKYTNKYKITLLLIGRYFSKEYGVLEQDGLEIKEISEKLGVSKTTLSRPLGELVGEKIIKKDGDGRYSIVYHQIKSVLNKQIEK